MLKKILLACLVVALSLALLHASSSATTIKPIDKPIDAGSNVAIYLIPHPDDESLTFSIPMLNDIRAGKRVYLVLFTSGTGTVARDTVNGVYDEESTDPNHKPGDRKYCSWHHRYHDPVAEHYLDKHLTTARTGELRLEEFHNSVVALGIPLSRVQIIPLNHFTYDSVRAVMRMQIHLFPNAQFKSMSRLDFHPQHALMGRVLDDLYANGEIKGGKVNFVSIGTDRFTTIKVPSYKMFLTNPSDAQRILNSIDAYKLWDPQHGHYALGYHSVGSSFESLSKDMYTKVSQSG